MPLISWINELFSEANEPYTLDDIETRLFCRYSSRVNKSSVWRALKRLEDSPATAKFVIPHITRRPAAYSAEGARRIARIVTANHEIDRDPALEVMRQFLKLERDSSAIKTDVALAEESPPRRTISQQ